MLGFLPTRSVCHYSLGAVARILVDGYRPGCIEGFLYDCKCAMPRLLVGSGLTASPSWGMDPQRVPSIPAAWGRTGSFNYRRSSLSSAPSSVSPSPISGRGPGLEIWSPSPAGTSLYTSPPDPSGRKFTFVNT